MRAIGSIGGDLSDAEVSELLAFLDGNVAEQTEYDALGYSALKNEAANVLHRQPSCRRPFADALVAMYHNTEHDMVWRGYCIQHLSVLCQSEAADGHTVPASRLERDPIISCLHDALGQIDRPMAGTAVIALARMADENGDLGGLRVADAALQLARDARACDEARATALQVAANADSREVLPLARRIARGAGSALLRMSAIAAVGRMGEGTDSEWLEPLTHHTDMRIRTAAMHAVKRIGENQKNRQRES